VTGLASLSEGGNNVNFNNFLLEVDKGIAVLTVNRPEVRNALNTECWSEIGGFVDHVTQNEEIKLAIITGAGEKVFVAGADVKAVNTLSTVDILSGGAQSVLRKIEDCHKPFIAAINGIAFGGGCELALACDIRIVAENALFGLPEVGIGLLPGAGGTQKLAKLIGLGRAKEVILAGRIISGSEAVQIGLAYKCVAPISLMDEAKAVADTILSKGPLAISLSKKLITASMATDQDAGFLLETLGFALTVASEDRAEGIDAFLNKRKPVFKGR
jgi:enoyl-CoA hydratase